MIILKNRSQYKYLLDHYPDLIKSHQVLTTNIQIWLDLFGCDQTSVCSAQLLTGADYNEIAYEAGQLSDRWFLPYDGLEYRGVNLAELCRIENTVFFFEVVAAHRVMERVLADFKPNEFVLFTDLNTPCIGRTRYNATHDVFEAVALKFAEKHGLSVKRLFSSTEGERQCAPTLTIKIVDAVDHFAKVLSSRLFRLLKRISLTNRRIKLSSFRRENGKFLALCYASGYDALMMEPIFQALRIDGEFQTILISQNEPQIGNSSRAGLDEAPISYILYREFEPFDSPQAREDFSHLMRGREKFRDVYGSSSEDLKDPLDNRYLKMQFDYLWEKRFTSAIKIIDAAYAVMEQIQPDVLVSIDMMSFDQRIFCKVARMHGIRTIAIPHGCINDIEEYEFESDIFLAWGQISKSQIVKRFALDDSRVRVTGSLLFEKINDLVSLSPKAIHLRKEELGLRRDARIVLILTGAFTTEVYGRLDLEKYVEAWNTVVQYAMFHPEIDFLIKPHPAMDYTAWYLRYIPVSGAKNIRIVENLRLEFLLPITDAAIMWQIISTALLIALLAKKPLIFLRNAIRNGFGHPSEDWNASEGLTIIENSGDLPPILNETLSDEMYRKRIIHDGQQFLEKYICRSKGSPADKIAKEFKSLLQGKRMGAV